MLCPQMKEYLSISERSERLHSFTPLLILEPTSAMMGSGRWFSCATTRFQNNRWVFAVQIIRLVQALKAKRETIIANQIGRSGTSIGANIREVQYAHGKPDFIAKLQIALKEANETGDWLELLFRTDSLDERAFKSLDAACASLPVMLISSINTAKGTP